ncbi:MAG: DUF5009 domain-containing protein [Verrucomicrobia bacterium]|nr:DUF5009 domain-containing protein [Verrucomicrobiota bacterium]
MTTDNLSPAPPENKPASTRVMSVDALRGFDMMWIVGAGSLVGALQNMSQNFVTSTLATQLEHVAWRGFRFYDCIFPLFVFLMGVSIVFSLTKAIEHGTRADAFKRIIRRFVLMFIVALFYSGGFRDLWPDIRLLGVLNRIALCYLCASLLFLFCQPRMLIGVAAGLLLGYWALLALVPIRDLRLDKESLAQLATHQGKSELAETIRKSGNPSTTKNNPVMEFARDTYDATTARVSGQFEPGYNLANHFDFLYLPGKKHDSFYDPEGFLSTIPAVVTSLLGVFAGLLLRSSSVRDQQKVWLLVGSGIAGIAVALLWDIQFPIIKKIWTSSYVLMAGGWSAIFLGVFYQFVDVWKFQRWCQPFVWIGTNSITIYLTSNVLGGFNRIAARLVGGDVKAFFEANVAKGLGDLFVALVGLGLVFWFCGFLHRRKIFLRL